MTSQPVSSIFSVLHRPLGLSKLLARPFPDVVFPPLFLSALSSSPFYCALQDGFGQTWWTGDKAIPLQLHLFTMVRRSLCGLNTCWILAQTSLLVTWSLYEMRSISQWHLISMVFILLWRSAMRGTFRLLTLNISLLFTQVTSCKTGFQFIHIYRVPATGKIWRWQAFFFYFCGYDVSEDVLSCIILYTSVLSLFSCFSIPWR